MLFTKPSRRIPKPRTVSLSREPIHWVDTARYLRMTLDTRLTWSTRIDQARKKAAQRLEVLGPVLNRRSGSSIRNLVLLYKQLICPMMDHPCSVWKPAACPHVRKLYVLQSKCLCSATNVPWFAGNT